MAFESEDPKLYFYEALAEALNRLRIKIEHLTEFYLVELLVRQIANPLPQEPLVLQMEAALQTVSEHERFLRYRDMGDSALLLVGFYEEALVRRGTTKHYVASMGGHAYRSAASLSEDGLGGVYITLSDGFDDFVQVLDEVREMTSARTQQDIVKLYEKWQRTGSTAAARKLQENGVFPVPAKIGRN